MRHTMAYGDKDGESNRIAAWTAVGETAIGPGMLRTGEVCAE